ncbi:ammonia-forming cytochrome c nitrite reductase subunit c552 [bacterium AH-315-F18]|nr:ammonia-forming cytochrome c nitrite reductase subunit c552 [bacterium AH-315-F18]
MTTSNGGEGFQRVFLAVAIGAALIVAAFVLNGMRPARDVNRQGARYIAATGKCASCHEKETSAVVHQYARSKHAQVGVTCLDCHRAAEGQETVAHSGFEIAKSLTAKNCAQCHTTEYEQFLKSRHAGPAWAAVAGKDDFSPQQIAAAEKYHPGTILRPANKLAIAEGAGVMARGCLACHEIGKPNKDGSIGKCTECHSRHNASVALARTPETCGQCHMGPDHSQIEIYHESKHGVLFNMQKADMNLAAPPKMLTTRDMPVPTCATCHMSGLEGMNVTHDTTQRLSYWLFAAVSKKRPNYKLGQAAMKETCLKCHAKTSVERFYVEAEEVVEATNTKVKEAMDLMAELRAEGLLTPEPFDEPIEFIAFDLWHYNGRTAKHGAFMGGADFVQWHGNYELLLKLTEMKHIAEELRKDR